MNIVEGGQTEMIHLFHHIYKSSIDFLSYM